MTIQPGTRVAYRAAFLRSIQDYSHRRAALRGVVRELADLDVVVLATVQWDGGPEQRENVKNLIPADRLHLEPA